MWQPATEVLAGKIREAGVTSPRPFDRVPAGVVSAEEAYGKSPRTLDSRRTVRVNTPCDAGRRNASGGSEISPVSAAHRIEIRSRPPTVTDPIRFRSPNTDR